ncbi:TRAP transporter large permease [Pusillimonas noertemannii]|uniref:TRAP transporter large permease n=1 Tax=Pusillimonas noertemannii TaxID=305977 RepID=UPI000312163C|nr:TRAP transporter large permease [Pusillimonas noertemannii]
MGDPTLIITIFGLLVVLIFLQVPVALVMLGTGILGIKLVTGSWFPILSSLKSLPFDTFSSYSLSVIPLFLLMGQFAMRGGLSKALFDAAGALLGHRRGGLAMASILACGAFGAVCGSSLATASTMATVALPEMRRYNYSKSLAAGCLAAGGTLGALIPPSVVLILYALIAEQNIVKLFAAAVVPGLIAIAGYFATIAIYVRLNKSMAEPTDRVPLKECMRSLLKTMPVVTIFCVMLGGIYTGIFTPTEGGAVGAGLTGLYAILTGNLKWADLVDCVTSTGITTAMIFFIVLGATLFNTFVAMTQLPQTTSASIAASGLNPWLVLACILLFLLVLGSIMDSVAMMLLTVPILLPVILALDFGLTPEQAAIWFGIVVLVATEIGVITPPLGMNLFIVQARVPDMSTSDMYRGIFPFICCDMVRMVAIAAFPMLSLVAIQYV